MNLLLALSISAANTVCWSQPLDGWERLTTDNEKVVQRLIQQKKAHYQEMPTLICIDYSQHPIREFYLNERWWKRT